MAPSNPLIGDDPEMGPLLGFLAGKALQSFAASWFAGNVKLGFITQAEANQGVQGVMVLAKIFAKIEAAKPVTPA